MLDLVANYSNIKPSLFFIPVKLFPSFGMAELKPSLAELLVLFMPMAICQFK
jgi:hypothetical protein